VRLGLESNDSVRLGLRWKVAEPFGQIITEIGNSIPPEFNEFNNIDSLRFDAALPLTLLSFTGQVQGQTALLQWSTTSEVNVKHFELERSTNGSTFTRIAQIAATNGTGTHQYSYPDADFGTLPATRVLYRLKMMDKDGQYTYSPIVLLSKQNTPLFSMKLYPNPAHQTANVEVISTTAGKAALQLMDVGGKQISLRTVEMVRGRQTYQLPLNGLAQGAYILVVQMQDGSRQVTRFVKD
jgi:hypothetical protein